MLPTTRSLVPHRHPQALPFPSANRTQCQSTTKTTTTSVPSFFSTRTHKQPPLLWMYSNGISVSTLKDRCKGMSGNRYLTTSSVVAQFREVNEDGSYEPQQEQQEKKNDVVFELNQDSFEDVTTSSVPLLVEAYIKQSNPQIEEFSQKLRKLVYEKSGFLRLARLDVSEQRTIAEELKITHVPSVIGIVEGKLFYNRLVGVPTDISLKKYVNALFSYTYGMDIDQILSEADAKLEQNDIPQAAKMFNTLLTDSKYTFAAPFGIAGLIQCALKEGNMDAAKHLVETLKSQHEDSLSIPRIKQSITQVELQSIDESSAGEVEELKKKIEQDPKDLQSRYDLALYYQKIGNYEWAMLELFQIVKIDREWNQQAAKQMLLKIFDSLGDEHELVIKGRKRLNNLWFT